MWQFRGGSPAGAYHLPDDFGPLFQATSSSSSESDYCGAPNIYPLLYENSIDTIEFHKWTNNGTHPNSMGNSVTYWKCKGPECKAKRRVETVGKGENSYKLAPIFENQHSDPPVVPKSPSSEFAELHQTAVSPAKQHNSLLREGIVVPKKQLYNKYGYQRRKYLSVDRFSKIENLRNVVTTSHPFSIIMNNYHIKEKPQEIVVDTTYKLLEEDLHLTTVLSQHLGIGIPMGHMMHKSDCADEYEIFFARLKTLGFKPTVSYSDFDQAIKNGLKRVWPEIDTKGDTFHFFKNNLDRNKSKQLNIDVSQLKTGLASLVEATSWAEFETKYAVFEETFAQYPSYLKYFTKTWIGTNPPERWSKASGKNPTSSVIEGYHHELKATTFDGKLGVQVDAAAHLINDSYAVAASKIGTPEAIEIVQSDSRSKNKRYSQFTGATIPLKKEKERKVMVNGRPRTVPANFEVIEKSILQNVDVVLDYPLAGKGKLVERRIQGLKWSPLKYPAAFLGTEIGQTLEKEWTISKIVGFSEAFFRDQVERKKRAEEDKLVADYDRSFMEGPDQRPPVEELDLKIPDLLLASYPETEKISLDFFSKDNIEKRRKEAEEEEIKDKMVSNLYEEHQIRKKNKIDFPDFGPFTQEFQEVNAVLSEDSLDFGDISESLEKDVENSKDCSELSDDFTQSETDSILDDILSVGKADNSGDIFWDAESPPATPKAGEFKRKRSLFGGSFVPTNVKRISTAKRDTDFSY